MVAEMPITDYPAFTPRPENPQRITKHARGNGCCHSMLLVKRWVDEYQISGTRSKRREAVTHREGGVLISRKGRPEIFRC